ncbi:hypothetical protein JTB14_005189 [Gonioctena quinquepunctata]|nr:hypothetical protein JTB14_005189 [Gonioctena quinquepunctata]
MATVLHGFETCGLWPSDRHKIRGGDYVAMETSLDGKEVRNILEEIRDTVSSGSVNTHAESSENRSLKANTGRVDPFDNPQPSTSICAVIQFDFPNLEETVQLPVEKLPVQKLSQKESTSVCAANEIYMPKDSERLIRSHLQKLSPIPRLKTVQHKLSKGTTASQVLTESPYENDPGKNIDDKKKKKVKLDLNKGNRGEDGGSKRNKSVELKTVVRKKEKASGNSEDEEWYCIICDENTKESIIQCIACKFWIHDLYAGVNKGTVVINATIVAVESSKYDLCTPEYELGAMILFRIFFGFNFRIWKCFCSTIC